MRGIMKKRPILLFALLMVFAFFTGGFAVDEATLPPSDKDRLRELDAYWAEVSRAVGDGDFEGYKATCHAQGAPVGWHVRQLGAVEVER